MYTSVYKYKLLRKSYYYVIIQFSSQILVASILLFKENRAKTCYTFWSK